MTDEDTKGGLVVREIFADHSLGEIFTLRLVGSAPQRPPMFDQSRDAGFVDACRALLANTIYLEQQDRGRLLGDRRMKWHDAAAWPGGKVPGDNDKWVCGKAFSFFTQPDGTRVGVCKMGWVTTSTDNGKTWSMPVVPPTLVTGKAKVWSQRTADGRFALVYNPSRKNRFPLVIVTSDDGVHFRDMRNRARRTSGSTLPRHLPQHRPAIHAAGYPSGATTARAMARRRCGWFTA